jgi:hypothetical protein
VSLKSKLIRLERTMRRIVPDCPKCMGWGPFHVFTHFSSEPELVVNPPPCSVCGRLAQCVVLQIPGERAAMARLEI